MSTQYRYRGLAGGLPAPWRDTMSRAILDALEGGMRGGIDDIELSPGTEYSPEQSGEQISSPTHRQPPGAGAPTPRE